MMEVQFTKQRVAALRCGKFYRETGCRLTPERDREGFWFVSIPDNFVDFWRELFEVGK